MNQRAQGRIRKLTAEGAEVSRRGRREKALSLRSSAKTSAPSAVKIFIRIGASSKRQGFGKESARPFTIRAGGTNFETNSELTAVRISLGTPMS